MANKKPATERRSHNPEIVDTLKLASDVAKEYGHEYMTLEHLAAALFEQPSVIEACKRLGVDHEDVRERLVEWFESDILERPGNTPHPTPDFHEVVTRCIGMNMFSRRQPTTVDLLLHLVQHPSEDSYAVSVLANSGLTSLALKRYLSHGQAAPAKVPDEIGGGMGMEPVIENAEDAERFLEKFTVNLNAQAAQSRIDPLIGREDEVGQIIQIVARRTKNNVVLVGDAGVGKTALAEGLALKIHRGEVPNVLVDAKVFSLDIGNLIAGTRFRGDFEERMKHILKALELISNSILFIDEIHGIMGAGANTQGSLDVANLLKPALARGTLRCIGSTTLEEFRKHFEKDRALLRRFKRVDVNEPSIEDAKRILMGLKPAYEAFHGVSYTDAAISAAVELTARYVNGAFLPDKAIDIMDNAGARQRIAPVEEKRSVIDEAMVEVEVSKVARMPVKEISASEGDRLNGLGEALKGVVFGQDSAVETLTDAIYVARAGLREENKPSGSYLFTGPTGVGKTEVARRLASFMGVPLIKYDMSEFMEKHSVARLIGAPPGYVGYGEGGAGNGLLINDIDQKPHSVLLLDEIEKAHPDVFNVLLQVMDDGRLTNTAGKSVSFRNVVLIMTSNAGAANLSKRAVGFGRTYDNDADLDVINKAFTPEFRNRLDAIVRFNRLAQENVVRIVEKFIAELIVMTERRNVQIVVSDAAKALLAEKGFDAEMGARPLARVIHSTIKIPLSRLMIAGPLKEGGVAKVEVAEGEIVITTD